jgi:hypothetical protein
MSSVTQDVALKSLIKRDVHAWDEGHPPLATLAFGLWYIGGTTCRPTLVECLQVAGIHNSEPTKDFLAAAYDETSIGFDDKSSADPFYRAAIHQYRQTKNEWEKEISGWRGFLSGPAGKLLAIGMIANMLACLNPPLHKPKDIADKMLPIGIHGFCSAFLRATGQYLPSNQNPWLGDQEASILHWIFGWEWDEGSPIKNAVDQVRVLAYSHEGIDHQQICSVLDVPTNHILFRLASGLGLYDIVLIPGSRIIDTALAIYIEHRQDWRCHGLKSRASAIAYICKAMNKGHSRPTPEMVAA